MRKLKFNILPAAALLLRIATATNAQKLPLIQQGSARAPQNVKIDGRLTEWANMPWFITKLTAFII
nr:hypothetical protein [uncultured Mucilaginibacter sp.]